MQALAWQIVSRCDLIQPNRLPEVEQLLLYLQSRKGVNEGDKGSLHVHLKQDLYFNAGCTRYVKFNVFVTVFCHTDKDVLEDSSRKLQEQMEDLHVVRFFLTTTQIKTVNQYFILSHQNNHSCLIWTPTWSTCMMIFRQRLGELDSFFNWLGHPTTCWSWWKMVSLRRQENVNAHTHIR